MFTCVTLNTGLDGACSSISAYKLVKTDRSCKSSCVMYGEFDCFISISRLLFLLLLTRLSFDTPIPKPSQAHGGRESCLHNKFQSTFFLAATLAFVQQSFSSLLQQTILLYVQQSSVLYGQQSVFSFSQQSIL